MYEIVNNNIYGRRKCECNLISDSELIHGNSFSRNTTYVAFV
jgi:hypothetical protein